MRSYTINYMSYLSYPTGDDIGQAIEFCNRAAKVFSEIPRFVGMNIEIVCRGCSGAILSALFAAELKKYYYTVFIKHVKKPGEISHTSSVPQIGYRPNTAIVMLDDFVSTGTTLKTMFQEINVGKIDCLILQSGFHEDEKMFGFIPDYYIHSR